RPGRIDLLVKAARHLGGAAPLDETRDLQNPHAAVESDRNHISRSHRPTGAVDSLTVDPYAARCRKPRRRRSRAHDPGRPPPLVVAAPIAVHRWLAPLLGVGFELLLKRSELREGRVRVGRLVAALLRRASGKKASLAGRTRRPIAAVGPRLARRTRLPRRTLGPRPLGGSRGRRRGRSSALRLDGWLLLCARGWATGHAGARPRPFRPARPPYLDEIFFSRRGRHGCNFSGGRGSFRSGGFRRRRGGYFRHGRGRLCWGALA